MLQRDLARQRREGEPTGPRKLDKTEVETAWQRAKLDMETDDFLDVLAENPSGKCFDTPTDFPRVFCFVLFCFVLFLFFSCEVLNFLNFLSYVFF